MVAVSTAAKPNAESAEGSEADAGMNASANAAGIEKAKSIFLSGDYRQVKDELNLLIGALRLQWDLRADLM